MLEAHGRTSRSHRAHRDPLAGLGGGEVERETGHLILEEPNLDGGLARDLVSFIVHSHAENIVLHIDPRLPGIGVGGAQFQCRPRQ